MRKRKYEMPQKLRGQTPYLAKVGVVGSNPIARSIKAQYLRPIFASIRGTPSLCDLAEAGRKRSQNARLNIELEWQPRLSGLGRCQHDFTNRIGEPDRDRQTVAV